MTTPEPEVVPVPDPRSAPAEDPTAELPEENHGTARPVTYDEIVAARRRHQAGEIEMTESTRVNLARERRVIE